jgi:hypothetical protein
MIGHCLGQAICLRIMGEGIKEGRKANIFTYKFLAQSPSIN